MGWVWTVGFGGCLVRNSRDGVVGRIGRAGWMLERSEGSEVGGCVEGVLDRWVSWGGAGWYVEGLFDRWRDWGG